MITYKYLRFEKEHFFSYAEKQLNHDVDCAAEISRKHKREGYILAKGKGLAFVEVSLEKTVASFEEESVIFSLDWDKAPGPNNLLCLFVNLEFN